MANQMRKSYQQKRSCIGRAAQRPTARLATCSEKQLCPAQFQGTRLPIWSIAKQAQKLDRGQLRRARIQEEMECQKSKHRRSEEWWQQWPKPCAPHLLRSPGAAPPMRAGPFPWTVRRRPPRRPRPGQPAQLVYLPLGQVEPASAA